ncbi:hypothetical protein ACLB1M_17970 [Escherichia coli]
MVNIVGGNNVHIGGDGKDGVYVVVDASDGQVSLANNDRVIWAQHKSPPVCWR